MPLPNRTIHIIGLGSIGTFIAHSLRSLPNPPPVKLLVHRSDLYEQLSSHGWKLGLRVGENGTLHEQDGFEGELLGESASDTPIDYLIVAVKASATVSALEAVRCRLGPHSTICLFQNGLGQVEDLNERLFVDVATRPTYVFGIMRHGVYLRSPVEAILSGTSGTAAVGVVKSANRPSGQAQTQTQTQSQYLLNILLQSPALRCEELEWADLLRTQLLKLAANCVLNPLTALLDVRNGSIGDNPDLVPLRQSLLTEISTVFVNLPEFKDSETDRERFSAAALTVALSDTVAKTAGNSSSMREDMRKGRETEIEYINGWVVKRGRELGVDCVANASVTQLVLAKSRLVRGVGMP